MNSNLPIAAFKDQIVEAVNNHNVVVLTADTGAGKSTQVPQFLHRAGYDVTVTQPRRMAARTVAERVAEELGTPLGEIVGFRTAEERYDSPQTRVLFCTDGLQLVLELFGRGSKKYVLVIDEVHEWNRNIDTLVAWVEYRQSLGHDIKVVLMSATIEAEKLAEYFGGAPIISVPGRLFPVKMIDARNPDFWTSSELAEWGFASFRDVPQKPHEWSDLLARRGRNVLQFADGKGDIAKTERKLHDLGTTRLAEVVPLHGELASDQQQRAFRHYSRSKVVVSTNVAQTSVTIDDIDAVVDPGTEKRKEVRRGDIEGLYLTDISQADCEQRKGRAGRTKPGIYVYCSDTPLLERDEFPTAEILRTRLDQTVLYLAEIGLDATELDFFHQPDRGRLVEAKEALERLGALDDEGKVTKIGKAMSRMPLDVHHARMVVEAEKRGVTNEILTIVACLEAGGIRGKGKYEDGVQLSPVWCKLTDEEGSDLLAELDCYLAASTMTRREMHESDIVAKSFFKAKEIRGRLARDFGVSPEASKANDHEAVLKAAMAGMVDRLYRHSFGRNYMNDTRESREIDRNSVVKYADWVTAVPIDLEVKGENRWGEEYTKVYNLLTSVTKVIPSWLVEVAPQLVEYKPLGFRYIAEADDVLSLTATVFNGQQIEVVSSSAHACPEATLALATALAGGEINYTDARHNDSVKEQVNRLHRRHRNEIEQLTTDRLTRVFAERLRTTYQVTDLSQINLRLEFAEFIPSEFLDEVVALEPETIEVDGVTFEIVYYTPDWSPDIRATVRVPAGQMPRVQNLPVLPKADVIQRVEAIDSHGEVVAGSSSLRGIKSLLQDMERDAVRKAERQKCHDEIKQLQQRCDELTTEGREVTQLRQIITKARSMAQSMYGYYRPASLGDVRSLIRRAENEIERLSGDPAAILLDDLMEGRIKHSDVSFNQGVIKQLEAYAIRSGGFIEALNEDQLRQHYQDKLDGATRVDELQGRILKLRLDDFAPADILEELELAPDTIELESKKGTKTYPVTYRYEEIDGERAAVGAVTVPLSVYERNVADGQASKFPRLPHSARLIIEVTENDQTVARGEDGDWLRGQIKKHRKAKQRGNNMPATDEFGLRRYQPVTADAPPPWFKGRAR